MNLRPVKLLTGAPCPLKGINDSNAGDIDMIFVRENTEGEYSGSGAWLYRGQPNEVVIQNGGDKKISFSSVSGYPSQSIQTS